MSFFEISNFWCYTESYLNFWKKKKQFHYKAGDELQLPPVPFEHSLLASTETTSDEHKAGVHIFGGFTHVYRLETAMRFQDDTLIAILRKMRTPGGAKLSQKEWQALQATCVDGPKDAAKLHKTENFFQACYTWSVVNMAYTVRSFESAKAAGATLYATRAVDVVQNLGPDRAAAVAKGVLGHANMNETGRLPHFGLYHVGMEVRLTQTLAAPHVVVDCIGIIRGFHFSEEDQGRGDLNGSFVVLRRLPDAIFLWSYKMYLNNIFLRNLVLIIHHMYNQIAQHARVFAVCLSCGLTPTYELGLLRSPCHVCMEQARKKSRSRFAGHRCLW